VIGLFYKQIATMWLKNFLTIYVICSKP